MTYVVSEARRGYSFKVSYNLDDISAVDNGSARVICGSAALAMCEGLDPDAWILRIWFKDGSQATFDYDMVDVYMEEE